MNEDNSGLNAHNKEEFPPMHTAEHILNGFMAKTFGCGRAFSAHIERKKSKCDYHMTEQLTAEQIAAIERYVNDVIGADVPVWMEYATQAEVCKRFDMERLPDEASEKVRIVHVGDYDECLCVGSHVEHTGQIGAFRISSSRFAEGVQRLVFRLDVPTAD